MPTFDIGGGNNDYADLAAWQTARKTAARTGPEIAQVFNDQTGLTLTGWTNIDSTNYVEIVGQTPMDGTPYTGVLISRAATDSGAMSVQDITNVKFRNLRFKNTGAGTNDHAYFDFGTTDKTVEFDNCVALDSSGEGFITTTATAASHYTYRNCISINNKRGFDNHTSSMPAANCVVESCLAYKNNGSGYGILQCTTKNSISLGHTNANYFNEGSGSDYNISSNTTGSGTNTKKSVTATASATPGAGTWIGFTSITAGSEDFNLIEFTDGSTNWAVDTADATSAPANDMVGTTRPQGTADDKGPLELSAGGGTTTLTPSLFTNTQTFYGPTVTRGSVSLTPSLFTNSQTFHAPTVSATYDLTPALYTNTQTFFAATVSPGEVTLTPALFTNSQTFFDATVSQGDTLLPSLFTNTQTFYGPTITVGAVTLTPERFDNDNRFFQATITGGVVVVSTKPSGAPGHRVKFRGRFYDSKRDRYRLAKDVEAFLAEKQEEAPQPQEKPRKRVIRTEVAAIPAPQVVLDTTEIDELTEVLTALKARDGQLRSYVAQLKAMNETLMAEEEEFLMMVA